MDHLKLRSLFKNFFEQQKHVWIQSAPLIPFDDPSLLFINAGMNPFKKKFLGTESVDHQAIASIQKCVRAGGKHNDLEEVGPSLFHHTFFEMMGNFSFGKYFKEEGCLLAWNFLTKELLIPKELLAISVFEKDQETAEIWNKKIGIPKEKIFFFGEKDNFWRMAEEGPCGPCTEIYYSANGSKDPSQMVEIWNLVFMEYKEDAKKKKTPLKQLCIDTGMGLERLLCVLQNKNSNYHTDLFTPTLKALSQKTNTPYSFDLETPSNASLRALADHIRTTTFLIGDGVLPSHEGRGYVLRRILRRALYLGSNLTSEKNILHPAVESIVQTYSKVYPELHSQKELINKTLLQEEEKFLLTLKQGKELLKKEIFELQKRDISHLPAKVSFKLYDTYGFPFDLIQMICQQEDIGLDQKGFEGLMSEARLKNKKIQKEKLQSQNKSLQFNEESFSNVRKTVFKGYDQLEVSAKILKLFDQNGSPVSTLSSRGFIIFDKTPFYPEGGGQVGDQGLIFRKKEQSFCGRIVDCKKISERYIHSIEKMKGSLREKESVRLQVDSFLRKQTAIHHSATHLLHAALRKVLGNQTKQSGSLVEPHRLRFDFTASQALSEEQIFQIEKLVNDEIQKSQRVEVSFKNYEKALKDGALSFFNKPSVQKVRVLKMGEFSHELCGGTHVNNTQDILVFKIMSEGSVSSGLRRIEALCGQAALQYLMHFTEENLKLRRSFSLSSEKNFNLMETIKKLKEQPKKSKSSLDISKLNINEKFQTGSTDGLFYCANFPDLNVESLGVLCDQIKKMNPSSIVVITGKETSGHAPIAVFLGSFKKDIRAQEIIQFLGGRGGGPPHFAKGALLKRLSQKDLREKTLKFFHQKELLKDLK